MIGCGAEHLESRPCFKHAIVFSKLRSIVSREGMPCSPGKSLETAFSRLLHNLCAHHIEFLCHGKTARSLNVGQDTLCLFFPHHSVSLPVTETCARSYDGRSFVNTAYRHGFGVEHTLPRPALLPVLVSPVAEIPRQVGAVCVDERVNGLVTHDRFLRHSLQASCALFGRPEEFQFPHDMPAQLPIMLDLSLRLLGLFPSCQDSCVRVTATIYPIGISVVL